MRAIGTRAAGAPLEPLTLPIPEPAPDELLVRVTATSDQSGRRLHRHRDVWLRGASSIPLFPGRDICGVVAQVGELVTHFAPGDRVLGCWTKAEFHLGAWAEFIAVPADGALAIWPAELTAGQAAALPLAAVTAQLGVDGLAPAPGESLLVVGASGAGGLLCGNALAAARGAQVIATAKPGEEDRLRDLGAAETIDYAIAGRSPPRRATSCVGTEVAAIFDIVNDKPQLLALSEARGRRRSDRPRPRFAADRRTARCQSVASRPSTWSLPAAAPEVLAPVLELARSGSLGVLVSDVRPLEQLPILVPESSLRGGAWKDRRRDRAMSMDLVTDAASATPSPRDGPTGSCGSRTRTTGRSSACPRTAGRTRSPRRRRDPRASGAAPTVAGCS